MTSERRYVMHCDSLHSFTKLSFPLVIVSESCRGGPSVSFRITSQPNGLYNTYTAVSVRLLPGFLFPQSTLPGKIRVSNTKVFQFAAAPARVRVCGVPSLASPHSSHRFGPEAENVVWPGLLAPEEVVKPARCLIHHPGRI